MYRLSDNGTCDGGRRRQQCKRSAVLACRARVPRSYTTTTTIWRAAASDRAIYSGWLVSGARARVCALADARVMCVRAVDADHENNNNNKKIFSAPLTAAAIKSGTATTTTTSTKTRRASERILLYIYIYPYNNNNIIWSWTARGGPEAPT